MEYAHHVIHEVRVLIRKASQEHFERRITKYRVTVCKTVSRT